MIWLVRLAIVALMSTGLYAGGKAVIENTGEYIYESMEGKSFDDMVKGYSEQLGVSYAYEDWGDKGNVDISINSENPAVMTLEEWEQNRTHFVTQSGHRAIIEVELEPLKFIVTFVEIVEGE